MPSEARPLFRADALRPKLVGFGLPPGMGEARKKLGKWVDLLANKQAEGMKETELLADFITDVFLSLLGFTRPASGGQTYTLKREALVKVGGKQADAALGRFAIGGDEARFIAVVEGKGPRDRLDRPFAGRALSAVDQALRYAVNLQCDWYVVTNLHSIRLYHKGHDQLTYERFETAALVENDVALRKLVYLLGAERMAPAKGRCHLDDLLADSEKIGLDLTRDYYREYSQLRREMFNLLRLHNKEIASQLLLGATQKILDRVLFIAFCEDRGLLPAKSIAHAYRHADPYNPRPIWDNFRGLFRAIDQGSPPLKIEQYNGGLFAHDDLLDKLKVPDEVCKGLDRLAAYEYRPPALDDEITAGTAAKLIDVEILGHIFEQSISDLEQLHQEIAKGSEPEAEPAKAGLSRRKKSGLPAAIRADTDFTDFRSKTRRTCHRPCTIISRRPKHRFASSPSPFSPSWGDFARMSAWRIWHFPIHSIRSSSNIPRAGERSMPVHMPGISPPQGANLAIDIHLTAQANITPFVASQKVTRFVVTEVSTQLLADTPELVVGERLCWSVPVMLTSPSRGIVGKVGDILVDVTTGELLVDDENVRRITEDARRLAERSPL